MTKETLVHTLSNLGFVRGEGKLSGIFYTGSDTRFDLWSKTARFDRWDRTTHRWLRVWSCRYTELELAIHGTYLDLVAGPVLLNNLGRTV